MPLKAPIAIGLLIALFATVLSPASAHAESLIADALERGDTQTAHSLIDGTAAVNDPQIDGSTALHWAVRRRDAATAELLLSAGADVQAANRYGVTPMYLAALNADAQMMAILLAAGADPDTATPGGETALMTAARTGNPNAVQMLIDHGADVDAREAARGQTALMWAVLERHMPVVELLVDNDADINAATTSRQPRGSQSPGSGYGTPSMAVFIPFAAATPDGGMTPLLFAIRSGDMQMTRFLLENGADPQLPSANGTTPLILALLNGQTRIATMLLELGVDPNAVDDYGRGPLFAAVDLRNFNFQRYTDQPTDGLDPLNLIEALLESGADPNQRAENVPINEHLILNEAWVDFDGQTPLIRAALSGDIDVMRMLLEHGADPRLTTRKGTTALMAAAGVNWKPTLTFTRSEDELLEAVRLCLELGIDVNAVNSQGFTAMHGAAHRGWTPIIRLLAEHGAGLQAQDREGHTPLDFTKGIFLTVSTSPPQPQAQALLEQLIDEAAGQ